MSPVSEKDRPKYVIPIYVEQKDKHKSNSDLVLYYFQLLYYELNEPYLDGDVKVSNCKLKFTTQFMCDWNAFIWRSLEMQNSFTGSKWHKWWFIDKSLIISAMFLLSYLVLGLFWVIYSHAGISLYS